MSNNQDNGNAAAMHTALKGLDEEMTFCERNVELGIGFALEGLREHCRIVRQILNAALSAPARNCDIHADFNDAITTLANKRNWHDGKWDSERYCILASWLLAPAAEEGAGK